MPDPRIHAAPAERNREAILAVLRRHLPSRGLVLEIASGTGQHVVHFAAHLPQLQFQPTDPDAVRRASIDAWAGEAGLANIRPARALDASAAEWPVAAADAVLCINMIHIAPWDAAIGLVRTAGRMLSPGGVLYLYGPYRRGGAHTAASNAVFDADLRRRDPAWGVRDIEAVAALAEGAGFAPPVVEPMPANNFSLIFRRLPAA
ncbi:MAG: DUF938 domain-containing protein [Rhodospirillales bacterium]|nr:DUF938 domain-containing protein [Rhodospirillales bacterium]MDE2575393.1 DUF938 domain-containing protein [Rhodospirillales bacterium]